MEHSNDDPPVNPIMKKARDRKNKHLELWRELAKEGLVRDLDDSDVHYVGDKLTEQVLKQDPRVVDPDEEEES